MCSRYILNFITYERNSFITTNFIQNSVSVRLSVQLSNLISMRGCYLKEMKGVVQCTTADFVGWQQTLRLKAF